MKLEKRFRTRKGRVIARAARVGGMAWEEGVSQGGGDSDTLLASQTCTKPSPDAEHSCWNTRRRDPRVNGADIYVCRITKTGMGTSRPCWRCVEWCRWAGVKRIFHWNGDEMRWDVVKVKSARKDQYETHADIRLSAGLVCASTRNIWTATHRRTSAQEWYT
jgi:hypothetical protein